VSDPRADGYSEHDTARPPGREDPDDYRNPFARDYDRLVHTTAFGVPPAAGQDRRGRTR